MGKELRSGEYELVIRHGKETDLNWSRGLADFKKWERNAETNVYEEVDTPLPLPVETYIRVDDVTDQVDNPIEIDRRFLQFSLSPFTIDYNDPSETVKIKNRESLPLFACLVLNTT